MIEIVLTCLILVTIAMVAIILLQRHEGGVLGMGAGSQITGLITSKSAGNLLTTITWFLGTAFFTLSFLLAILVVRANKEANTKTETVSIAREDMLKEIQNQDVEKSEVKTIDKNVKPAAEKPAQKKKTK
jgi:preprotein translocase subunit SecG